MKDEYLRSLQLCEDQSIQRKLKKCVRKHLLAIFTTYMETRLSKDATVKGKKTYLHNLLLSIIAIPEINAQPMSPLSSGSVSISNQFYVIFHNTIPQKPVQGMSSPYLTNIKRGCYVNVETVSALVFR